LWSQEILFQIENHLNLGGSSEVFKELLIRKKKLSEQFSYILTLLKNKEEKN